MCGLNSLPMKMTFTIPDAKADLFKIACRKQCTSPNYEINKFINQFVTDARRKDELAYKVASNYNELLQSLARAAGQYFNIEPELILHNYRGRDYATARYIIVHILRHEYGLTMTTIGALIKRDHTTIIYGLRQVQNWLDTGSINFYDIKEIHNLSKFNQNESNNDNQTNGETNIPTMAEPHQEGIAQDRM